jgi:hypothetical protein
MLVLGSRLPPVMGPHKGPCGVRFPTPPHFPLLIEVRESVSLSVRVAARTALGRKTGQGKLFRPRSRGIGAFFIALRQVTLPSRRFCINASGERGGARPL